MVLPEPRGDDDVEGPEIVAVSDVQDESLSDGDVVWPEWQMCVGWREAVSRKFAQAVRYTLAEFGDNEENKH